MKITECKKCGHKKGWPGDDITCPFQGSGSFGENWNCGIIGDIRKLCREAEDNYNAEDGNDYRLHYQYCDDQKYVTIRTYDINIGLCLWVSWYKSRGATEAMFILEEDNPPRVPTFDELKAIVEHYKR